MSSTINQPKDLMLVKIESMEIINLLKARKNWALVCQPSNIIAPKICTQMKLFRKLWRSKLKFCQEESKGKLGGML